MSKRKQRRETIADILAEMETDVADLLRWATVVYDLGSSDNCSREGVQLVGSTMGAVAKRVKDSWDAALALAWHGQGGRA